MSVIVKGIGMPEGCELCPMYNEDSYYCQLDGRGVWEYRDYRPDWCPLVEVPMPHGRLIDADEAIKRLGKLAEEIEAKSGYERGAPYAFAALFLKNEEEFPTIIEAEKAE